MKVSSPLFKVAQPLSAAARSLPFHAKVLSVPCGQLLMGNYVVSLIKP